MAGKQRKSLVEYMLGAVVVAAAVASSGADLSAVDESDFSGGETPGARAKRNDKEPAHLNATTYGMSDESEELKVAAKNLSDRFQTLVERDRELDERSQQLRQRSQAILESGGARERYW